MKNNINSMSKYLMVIRKVNSFLDEIEVEVDYTSFLFVACLELVEGFSGSQFNTVGSIFSAHDLARPGDGGVIWVDLLYTTRQLA